MTNKDTIVFTVQPGGKLVGQLRVPGDKSISHRSVMLGSLAEGTTRVSGFLDGEDSLATLAAFRAMGVTIDGPHDGRLDIQGVGMTGLQAAAAPLDLGNSGTSMRLLSGLLAGQSFESSLVGDASLSKRPMLRVTEPLQQMGAVIETTSAGTAPLKISPATELVGIDYTLPVASAQIKSCLLLAGLYAQGTTRIREPGVTRDHTERMLSALGYPVKRSADQISVQGGGKLTAGTIAVPADISSAAFFMVGASIAPDSDILLLNVGMNPTRLGVVSILQRMGANIELVNQRQAGDEPMADIRVQSSHLVGIDIPLEWVPLAIDEFPAIFIAAACAQGQTRLQGAAELRVKESDRIQVMADGLQQLGIQANPTDDGMVIEGGQIQGGTVNSHGDHRIAMAFAMAGLRASEDINILDCANVNTSFPNFVDSACQVGLSIASHTKPVV